jgi:hypothetical protein
MPPRRRLVAVLAAAILFGVVAAWGKGQAADGLSVFSQVRGALGNLSTPWLLLPFCAGTVSSRPVRGAVLGLVVTVVALVAFYTVTAAVLRLDGHGFLASVLGWMSANRGYFEAGLLTGPLCGALGVAWQSRSGRVPWLPVGALLVGEPLVLWALGLMALPRPGDGGPVAPLLGLAASWGLGAGTPVPQLLVYAVEGAIGVLVLVAVRVRRSAM